MGKMPKVRTSIVKVLVVHQGMSDEETEGAIMDCVQEQEDAGYELMNIIMDGNMRRGGYSGAMLHFKSQQ